MVIKYFTRACCLNNIRSFKYCLKCGEINSERHALDYCSQININRTKELNELERIFKNISGVSEELLSISDYFYYIFFKLEQTQTKRKYIGQAVEILKRVITNCMMTKNAENRV
jgi:hypothetical protein